MTMVPPPAFSPDIEREARRHAEEILRGTVEVVPRESLHQRLCESLATGRPLRVKLGVDPTASLLHLGFTVPLRKLRACQDLGHQAVLIIGDVTARVGDPTGKSSMRPRLEAAEVDANATTYLEQAGKVLDLSRLEIRRNSEWLAKLGFEDFVGLLAKTTVAQLLEREDFKARHSVGTPIWLHEFLYPLLQGYDSVIVRSDIELGGTDQLWNLLMGREMQERFGQTPQICITTPLLVGLDGKKKMSKSHGNTIGIAEPPLDMVKKVMRVDDGQIRPWFTLLTKLSFAAIDDLLAEGRNPRDAKLALGEEIVADFHGRPAGQQARDAWIREVAQKELPDDVPSFSLAELGLAMEPSIVDLLVALKFADSRSEARRLITGGAVSLGDVRIEAIDARVIVSDGAVLRAGRRKVARLTK